MSSSSSKPSHRVFVVGVGMTKFEKPGKRDWDYPQMGKESIDKALADSGIPFSAIEQACCGYVYGDSTCGQRALYESGITGIPVYNVNNNCSTGSTALYMAKQFISSGLNDCVLAFGFEKMEKGSLKSHWDERTNPLDKHIGVMSETDGITAAPFACQMFANAGREHMKKYGTTLEHFAKISVKNHKHSVNNPLSQFRDEYTLEQVMKAPMVHSPCTKPQCCPTSEGGAAAILVSEKFVHQFGLQKKAIEIVGMAMATDFPSTFTENSMIKVVGFDMSKTAADKALQEAGMKVTDVQVVELHDCFSANELITYEALGLCPIGKAGEFIDSGNNTYGGKYVVNPSGGLISKGHPLGATGLAQCAELTWQLRGEADKRQVKGATAGLQHNLGLGGAAVVTIYKKPNFSGVKSIPVSNVSKAEAFKSAPKLSDFDGSVPVAATPAAEEKKEKKSSTPAAAAAPASGALKSSAVFTELSSRVNGEMVKKVNSSFRFDIQHDSDNSKITTWLLDLKSGNGSLRPASQSDKADCIIIIKDSDFVALMSGKLNAQQAFMKGQFKVKGNMMLAQKLQLLKATPAKM